MPKKRGGPFWNKQTRGYYFDEMVGFHPNKRRIRFSLRTNDPRKARFLWEQEYERRWKEYYGIQARDFRQANITFAKLADEFVKYQRDIKKIKEWRTEQARLDITKELWGDKALEEIGHADFTGLDKHLRRLDPPRTEATINHYFSLLKTLFNFAIRQGVYLRKNPVTEMKPYLTASKRREYSSGELDRILEAAEQIEKEARPQDEIMRCAKGVILLLVYTGMRMGEVLNLRWDNVKKDSIVLERTETKQRKEKTIPLTPGVREVLGGYEARRKDGFVLPLRRRTGGTIKAGWANNLLKRIRQKTGIEDFIFHNLRHTVSSIMVSNALGKGVGLSDIMKILGHSNIATTMKYLHSDQSRMARAMAILEKKVRKKPAKK